MTGLLLSIDPAQVKPGWLGLGVVLTLAVVTVILWRSMNRQLKKVDFDDSKGTPGDQPGGTATDRPAEENSERRD